MARNPVCLPLYNFSKKLSQFQASLLIIAVFEIFSVKNSQRISLLSATQFTVEKSDFERSATTDRNCSFCSTTSNFAQNFAPEKVLLGIK